MRSLLSNSAGKNSNVSEQLVVVTYQEDIPQFEVMLHCLNKYWQGNRSISIAYTKYKNYPTDSIKNQVKQIAKNQLTNRWDLNFVEEITTKMTGYDEQQVYKIFASLNEKFEDSIVLDSKDFLLKPANISDFKNNNRYNMLRFLDPNKSFLDLYPRVGKDLNINVASIPLTLILTPWIWNRKQLQKYWDHLIKIFPVVHTNWTSFPTGSEWAGYYAYTVLDQQKLIEITPIDSSLGYWMPIGGIWKGQSLAEILEQEKSFDLFPQRKFWKHHRAASTKESIEVTARVLSNHGITSDVISNWKEKNSNYILR